MTEHHSAPHDTSGSSDTTGASRSSHTTDGIAKVHDLIKDQRTAMLTTRAEDGSLMTRPMTCQEAEFDGTLWFLGWLDGDAARHMQADPKVNVAFTKEGAWVSIAGTGSVAHDPAKAEELWSPFAKVYFQCESDDPRVGVMRIQADSAEYWDSPGKPIQLLGIAKALITGSEPDQGDNETVTF